MCPPVEIGALFAYPRIECMEFPQGHGRAQGDGRTRVGDSRAMRGVRGSDPALELDISLARTMSHPATAEAVQHHETENQGRSRMTTETPRTKALFLGSVGTLAETSELQRQAYNAAFTRSGLDWHWSPDTYRALLHDPGGVRRIEAEARRRAVSLDAEAVHRRKVDIFRDLVRTNGLSPRPGVVETLEAARAAGLCVALVTTTGRDTVDLVLDGLGGAITAASFDFICIRSDVAKPKPAPDVYEHALNRAGIAAEAALAIEDTPESVMASLGAGIRSVALPGWAAKGRDFPDGVDVVPALSPAIFQPVGSPA